MITCSIFIIVGSLLLAAAVNSLRKTLRFLKEGEQVVGKVVQLDEKTDEDGTYYYPVFDIHTSRQEKITYSHSTGTSFSKWKIGETRNFIFMPGNPHIVKHLSYWKLFGWSLSLMAVAVDLLVIGGGYFLLSGYFSE